VETGSSCKASVAGAANCFPPALVFCDGEVAGADGSLAPVLDPRVGITAYRGEVPSRQIHTATFTASVMLFVDRPAPQHDKKSAERTAGTSRQ